MQLKQSQGKAVWNEDTWLKEYAGKTLEEINELQDEENKDPANTSLDKSKTTVISDSQNEALPAKKFKSNPRVFMEIKIGKLKEKLESFINF